MSVQHNRIPTVSIVKEGSHLTGRYPVGTSIGWCENDGAHETTTLSKFTPQHSLKLPRQKAFDSLEYLWNLKEGELPSNATIETWLHDLHEASKIDTRRRRLSGDGERLLKDFRLLLRVLRDVLFEKNSDEKIQHFVRIVTKESKPAVSEDINKGVAKGTEKAPKVEQRSHEIKDEVKRGYESMLIVAQLLTTNQEFRDLLHDLVVIFRDMFGDAALKIGELARPSEEERRRAFDGYTDREEGREGFSEDRRHSHFGHGNIHAGNQFSEQHSSPPPISTGQQIPSVQDSEQSDNIFVKGRQYLKDQFTGSQHEAFDRTSGYVTEKVPPKTRQTLIYRLKTALYQVQADESYQEAINYLFELSAIWANQAAGLSSEAGSAAKNYTREPAYVQAQSLLKQIIEAFAQNKSLDPLFNAMNIFFGHVRQDPALQHYFEEVNTYLKRLLQEPGYFDNEDSNYRGNELIQRGQNLLGEKYRPDMNRLNNEAMVFLNALVTDPVTKRFGTSIKAFGKDLLLDENNSPTFKMHLFQDFRSTFFPIIFQHIHQIPIPRIEYTDEHYDAVIENMVLTSDTFFPNRINIDVRNHITISPVQENADKNQHWLYLDVQGLHAEAKDVAFQFKKKTGFLKPMEYGSAKVQVGQPGRGGISFNATLTLGEDDDQMYRVSAVHVNVKNLKVIISGKKHGLLLKLFKPTIVTLITKQIEQSLESTIRETLDSTAVGLSNFVSMIKTKAWDNRHDMEDDEYTPYRGKSRRSSTKSFLGGFFRRNFSKTDRRGSLRHEDHQKGKMRDDEKMFVEPYSIGDKNHGFGSGEGEASRTTNLPQSDKHLNGIHKVAYGLGEHPQSPAVTVKP
ncbi:hypothetical protein G9A89_005671 [Geosiphon pyriformis]|nr:hypothetical protein G9A89_005671 [Geosiphon pyriformis]